MAKFSGNIAAIFAQTGPSVAMTNEATVTSDRYTYRIQNRSKRYIDRNAAVTVRVNGNVVSSGYTVDYFLGAVTFSTQREANDVVTISGRYLPVAEVGQGFEWTLELANDTIDVSDFSTPYRQKLQNDLKDGRVTLTWWWGDEMFFSAVNSGSPLIVSLFIDDTSSMSRYDCLAYAVKVALDVPVNEVIKEKAEFQVVDLAFITGGL